MSKIKENKVIQGVIIVLACMLIQAIPFGVAANIQPQFVSYVVEGRGFTLSQFSLIFTLGTIVSAIASPMIGKLYSKVNVKILFIVGATLSGGGFLLYGFCKELWQYYLVAGITQIGTVTISAIGVPFLINAWFDETIKGKALGIAFSGGSIGNIFLQQMVVFSLVRVGYSKSYIIFGAISLLVGIPVSLLMIRLPRKKDEIITSNKQIKCNNDDSKSGYSLSEVKVMWSFWVFSFGMIGIGIAVAALAAQYPAYLKNSIGLAPKIIARLGSMFAVFSLVGNLVGGIIFDKLGIIKSLVIGCILSSGACLGLIFTANNNNLAYLFVAFMGLSVFVYMIGPAYLTGVLFGKKDYGAILGIINLMFAVGFSIGSTLFGVIVDSRGYIFGWVSMLGVIIVTYVLLILSSSSLILKWKRNSSLQ